MFEDGNDRLFKKEWGTVYRNIHWRMFWEQRVLEI